MREKKTVPNQVSTATAINAAIGVVKSLVLKTGTQWRGVLVAEINVELPKAEITCPEDGGLAFWSGTSGISDN